MHAAFRLAKAIGVFAFDAEGDALQTGGIAGERVGDLPFPAARIKPAAIHAGKHFRPILRLGAARAGVDGEDAIALVMRAVQESFQLEGVEVGEQFFRVTLHLGFELQLHRFRFGGGEFEHDLQVFHLFGEAREGIEFAANIVGLIDDFLRGLLVVPESFAGHLRFKFREAVGQFGDVKETSAGA